MQYFRFLQMVRAPHSPPGLPAPAGSLLVHSHITKNIHQHVQTIHQQSQQQQRI